MGRLSCLPSHPWPFLGITGALLQHQRFGGYTLRGQPCPALGGEPGGEEHSAPCVPEKERQRKILGVRLRHHHHHHPPPPAQNTHKLEAAALLGRAGRAARLSALPAGTQGCAPSAASPCFSSKPLLRQRGFQRPRGIPELGSPWPQELGRSQHRDRAALQESFSRIS